MPRFPRLARHAAPLLLALLGSCNYLADRGLDLVDPYRIAGGAGTAVGIRGRSMGLVDTGLMLGLKPKATSIGWQYGTPLFFNQHDSKVTGDQAEIIKTTSVIDLDYAAGSYYSARNSAALLPALFSWVDSTPTDFEWHVPDEGDDFDDWNWIWSANAFREARYEQIHIFDIDGGIALLLFLDLGWSPGEALDFFLGIVTIDIADDDDRL